MCFTHGFKFFNSETSRCWQDMKRFIFGQHAAEPLWRFRQCCGIFCRLFRLLVGIVKTQRELDCGGPE